MYKDGYVVAIKNSNKEVLRDSGYKVLLPYYEEYSLLLKNEHDTKAVATVRIDGEEISNGRFIIDANDSVSIERFVEDLDEGRKFQFVPQNDSRISSKKDSGELGIIEVEFKREKKLDNFFNPNFYYSKPMNIGGQPQYTYGGGQSITARGMSLSCSTSNCVSTDFGGTAEGSRSTQKFSSGHVGTLMDEVVTIRIRLVPVSDDTATTVKETKSTYCIHCGKKNPTKAQFCMKCGNIILKF